MASPIGIAAAFRWRAFAQTGNGLPAAVEIRARRGMADAAAGTGNEEGLAVFRCIVHWAKVGGINSTFPTPFGQPNVRAKLPPWVPVLS